MEISELVKEAHKNAIEHGWWEKPSAFGELLSLVHEEVSETLNEYRNGRLPNETYYSGKRKFKSNDSTIEAHTFVSSNVKGKELAGNFCTKPEGIPSELADIVIRVFDICGYYGINLESAIREKMEFNKTRPYKHGGKKI